MIKKWLWLCWLVLWRWLKFGSLFQTWGMEAYGVNVDFIATQITLRTILVLFQLYYREWWRRGNGLEGFVFLMQNNLSCVIQDDSIRVTCFSLGLHTISRWSPPGFWITLIPKKGLQGHRNRDCLWLSALRVWALCKLLQTCWRGWCPRCWFPPGVVSRPHRSRGTLECVSWSCRPAAASLPPGMVLEKKTKEIFYDWAWLGTGIKCPVKATWKMKAARLQEHFFICPHPFLPSIKQKHFPSLHPLRLILSLLLCHHLLLRCLWAPCSSEPWLLRMREQAKNLL